MRQIILIAMFAGFGLTLYVDIGNIGGYYVVLCLGAVAATAQLRKQQ